MNDNKVILIILDGWGIAENPKDSAIDHANIDYYWHLWNSYPRTSLEASGKAVGLPAGQMGNSEVGHMNLGAGRIVFQELERIFHAFESREVYQNSTLQNLVHYSIQNQKPIHLIGLLSDGGVHSHIGHLKEILQFFQYHNVKQVYIHCFLDGRDTDPKSGVHYLEQLQRDIKEVGIGKIASIVGRYYAMDRDKRWERVAKAYHMLVNQEGKRFENPITAVENSYTQGITDEFVEPILICENEVPITKIQNGDAVFFFNFRTDRGRELTEVLSQKDFPEHNMHALNLHFVTLTRYDSTFKNVSVVFEKEDIGESLGEVLAKNQKKQIRIAETEKYPHVTYFFNGGKEEPFEGEKRILCPSPKVATYDLQPEMSAYDIRDAILPEIEAGEASFICLNFANPDMVGHTGVWKAAVKACEVVCDCLEAVVKKALHNNYEVIIISDHGNVDKMKNEDGSPHTAHTTSLVPCIFVSNKNHYSLKKSGKLGDIAPTILKMLNLQIPTNMTGEVLIID